MNPVRRTMTPLVTCLAFLSESHRQLTRLSSPLVRRVYLSSGKVSLNRVLSGIHGMRTSSPHHFTSLSKIAGCANRWLGPFFSSLPLFAAAGTKEGKFSSSLINQPAIKRNGTNLFTCSLGKDDYCRYTAFLPSGRSAIMM